MRQDDSHVRPSYPRFDLLIFDYNGTLADDFHRFYNCGVRRIFRTYGMPCPPPEQYRAEVTGDWMSSFYWPNGIPRSATAEDLHRIFRSGIMADERGASLFPDAVLTLKLLRRCGYPLALVSALDDDLLRREAAELDLTRHFDLVRGDAADKATVFRQVAERLLGPPANPLLGHRVAAIGDMTSDAEASLRAGIYPFLCPRGFQNRERLEDVVHRLGFGRVIDSLLNLVCLLPQ